MQSACAEAPRSQHCLPRQGYRSDNAAGDVISGGLPRGGIVKRHQPAVPHGEVAHALALVDQSGASTATKLAFEFLVLTVVRSGEARGARWSEIDLGDANLWTVPAARMKGRVEHKVPLSSRAARVLESAAELGGRQGLVFPSKDNRELSVATFSRLLRDLGVAGVPHGFRSSFRDWCSETQVSREVAEDCLAHAVGGVEGRYRRTTVVELRRVVMENWARYIDETEALLPAGKLQRSRRIRADSAKKKTGVKKRVHAV